jgi:hypothetical protein
MDQIALFDDAFLIAQDVMKLSFENQRELLFVRVHVKGRTLALELGHDPGFHQFPGYGFSGDGGVKLARRFGHLGHLIKRHVDLL